MRQRAGNNARQTMIGGRRYNDDDFFERHPILFAIGGFLFVIILNLIFWGALIWGTLALLNHYHVI